MNLLALEIKKISAGQAQDLAILLSGSEKDYSRHFIPFTFDFETISKKLSDAIKDQFYGIYVDNNLVGFYMLRGFDDGYEIPSYGVWVAQEFASKGISKLTLQHAFSFCKTNGIRKIMLKVHPENLIAKKIYEDFGFVKEGMDKRIGHFIYTKHI